MKELLQGKSRWMIIPVLCWMIWVLLDYWVKHPFYGLSFSNVKYGIPMIHVLVGLGFFFLIQRMLKNRLSWLVLMGLFLALLWSGTLVNLLMYTDNVEYSMLSILYYMLRTMFYLLILVCVTLSARVVGNALVDRVSSSVTLPSTIHIALGLSIFMIVVFIVLAFRVFYPVLITTIFLAPLLILYPYSRKAISALLQPALGKEFDSPILLILVMLVVLMNAITFAYTLSPFPVGFDAQKYYINLPKLMAEAGVLRQGYQPYNWSLLQAAMYKMSGRPELLLIFSWYGMLLVQWATWQFGRICLNMKGLHVVLAIILFSYMPAVTRQASQELKVDLGLTFILLAMMIAVYFLLNIMKKDGDRMKMVGLAFIIGWLCGIALGIKLTAVIALFGVLSILWYQALGRMAFIGFFLTFLGIAFFAKLDARAGLRVYHDSVIWLQYISLFLGFGFLFFAFKEQIKRGLKLLYLTTVIFMTSAVVFCPWLLKNYTEIKKPTMMKLLNGTKHGPDLNMKIIDKNLRESRKNNDSN